MIHGAAVIAATGLAVLWLGYRLYGGWLGRRVFESDGDDSVTPAVARNDGNDFCPTPRHILWGHHFTSVAGAAPILGPAVAIVYGWLPAVLWILLGVIFIGAVQDFGALVLSARNEGRSIGDIAGDLISGRARVLFLLLIVVLTWLVLAAFASVIGNLFHRYPASVLPVNLEIPLALLVGWWVHSRRGGVFWPSVAAVIVMWGSVVLAAEVPALQWTLPGEVLGLDAPRQWVVLLLGYAFVTCLLPVWVLLQPRDYINSHQLWTGLAAIYLAVFIANPVLAAPAVNDALPEGMEGIFPFLFVTIACGAISGFHALVSSGTTSKQLASLRDARPIGYGTMLLEASLALAATLAVAAGFDAAGWHAHYGTRAAALAGGGLPAFVEGTSHLLEDAFPFMDRAVCANVVAVIVISFAATTLDTACRIQRYCISELGAAFRVAPLRNLHVAAVVAAFSPLFLVFTKTEGMPLWQQVWPVFGAANQVLGALALLVLSLWLRRGGKPFWVTLIPSLLLAVVTVSGLWTLAADHFARLDVADPKFRGSWAVLAPAAVLLALAGAILVEGLLAMRQGRRAGVSGDVST